MPLVSSTETEKFAEYRKFIKNYQGTTCTQDPDWTLVKSNWEGYNVYLDDETGKIIAAVTIQTITNERGWTFAYGLKGPMMDRTDLVLMQKLYDEVENVLSDKQVFLIRMDPETVYTEEYKKALESAGFIVRGGGLDSHGTIQPRFNMVLDLVNKTPEDLMAEFHKKTRYNIRLAGRRDVEVKWDDSDEAIETFFKLHFNRFNESHEKLLDTLPRAGPVPRENTARLDQPQSECAQSLHGTLLRRHRHARRHNAFGRTRHDPAA